MRDKLPGTPEGIRYVLFFFAKPGEPGIETETRGALRVYGCVFTMRGHHIRSPTTGFSYPHYKIAFDDPNVLPVPMQEVLAVRTVQGRRLTETMLGGHHRICIPVDREDVSASVWQEFIDTMGGAYEWPT